MFEAEAFTKEDSGTAASSVRGGVRGRVTIGTLAEVDTSLAGRLEQTLAGTLGAEEESLQNAMQADLLVAVNCSSVELLQIEAYKETGTCILKGIDEYMALLDEHITTTQAMSFSAFKGPFEERIDTWNETLNTVSEMLDEWATVQKSNCGGAPARRRLGRLDTTGGTRGGDVSFR